MSPETNNDHRHLHGRVDDLHSRVTEAEKDSMERDHAIEKRQERTTGHVEKMSEGMKALQEQGQANADRQAKLQGMHEQFLKENEHTCRSVDKAVDIATAARTKAEDVEIATNPVVEAHKADTESKKDWRKLVFKVLAYIGGAGGLAVLGAMANHFLNGG